MRHPPASFGFDFTRRGRPVGRRSRLLVLVALGLGAGCMERVRLEPTSLAGSRERVTVTFPTPQPLRARAAATDSALGLVSELVGWPVAVRGDTVDLQVDRWQSGPQQFEMAATDYIVSIPPGSGAVMHLERGDDGGTGTLLAVLGALAIAVLVVLSEAFADY